MKNKLRGVPQPARTQFTGMKTFLIGVQIILQARFIQRGAASSDDTDGTTAGQEFTLDLPSITLDEAQSLGNNVFEAHDCGAPTHIQDLGYEPLDTGCDANSQVHQHLNASYQLLIDEEHRTYPGVACSMTKTQSAYYCGVYDHQTRFDEENYILREVKIPAEDCKQWSRDGQYKIAEGRTEVLKKGINHIKYFHVGSTKNNGGEIQCTGGTITLGANTLNNMVVWVELILQIEETSLSLNDKEVIVDNTGRKLTCPPSVGECHSGNTVYWWKPPKTPEEGCTLAFTRSTTGQLVSNAVGKQVFMSTDQSMVRLILQEPVTRCGRQVHSTNYPKLFLYDTEGAHPFTDKVNPQVSSIHTYVDNKDDFLYNHVKAALQQEYSSVLQNGCQQQLSRSKLLHWLQSKDPGLTTWIMGNGIYATTAGEVLYRYQCRTVYVKATADGLCYQGLKVERLLGDRFGPISSTTPLFMEPLTRRLTKHGIATPCSPAFRPKYKNIQGIWMTVLPTGVVKGQDPQEIHLQVDERKIMAKEWDWTQGGIYTASQKAANEAYQDLDRALTDFSSRLSKQTTPHDRLRELLPVHVFPSLRDPRSYLSETYDQILEFLSSWGKGAAVIFSLYTLGKFGFWLFNLVYGIIVLRHVHGCGRMLWWAPCLKVMYLRQYRKFKFTQRQMRAQATGESMENSEETDYEASPSAGGLRTNQN